jgi:hypothetical protein
LLGLLLDHEDRGDAFLQNSTYFPWFLVRLSLQTRWPGRYVYLNVRIFSDKHVIKSKKATLSTVSAGRT